MTSLMFEKAPKATLNEIVREAELYLQAQLAAAIAADQRAMAFAALVAYGTVDLAEVARA